MKKGLVLAYIAAGLLFLSGAAGTYMLLKPKEANAVQILRDDEILYTIDLNNEDSRFIRIDYGDSYNVVEIKDGRIRVKEADCKDNICVRTGWLSSSAPIVCLPNHLVIKFASASGEIDAVAR